MHSDAFKRKLGFSFTVIHNFGLKQLLKSLINKALEYKAILKFINDLFALLHIS